MRAISPGSTVVALWLCWIAYWTAASLAVKPSARRETMLSRLLHLAPLAIAVLLIWGPSPQLGALRARFVPPSPAVEWTGAVLVAAGLAFAVWARIHLGANWSGIVTVKRGHELVTGGPYAIVRHPIYTGLVLAFVGSAIALGELRGVLAVAVVAASLWRKLRLEERWMAEQFGADYERYRRRVRALVPFVL
ncbi:MAG TPA: isoprenylcysteine carboxylmethyltransferase family protein [Caldimonas sp.]|jgi:protein-S-isoprenylcysteine O-methyltransferase Ste14|nr:isoprenylcysteine carboxylmethyltransferase family protein [Caldimonas sp.]